MLKLKEDSLWRNDQEQATLWKILIGRKPGENLIDRKTWKVKET